MKKKRVWLMKKKRADLADVVDLEQQLQLF